MTTAYMQTHHKVSKAQYEAMSELCKDLHESTYKLFCHILVCTLLKLRNKAEGDDDYSPVSCYLIRRSAPGASWDDLDTRELIDHTPYSERTKTSKKYRVREWVLKLFFDLGDTSIVNVNLFTGKVSKAIYKNIMTDETGNSQPALIQAAMDLIKENKCIYNLPAVRKHLLEAQALYIEKELEAEANPSSNLEALVDRLTARYRNDYLCFKAIEGQKSKHIGDGFYKFTPGYNCVSTGRIHHIRGGLQSCSREMKAAAYSNYPALKNYDLKASQNNIAIQLMEEAGINTKWLCDYRDKPNNKHVYAELVGISVDGWKTCLLAMLMGAHQPKRSNKFEERDNAILNVLGKEAKGDPDEVFRLHDRFKRVVAGLNQSLDQWHEWLIHCYIPANQRKGGQANKYYIRNKAEKLICINDLPKSKRFEWKVKAKVAAFLLQGQEATFIHHLTVLSKQYSYKPIANEHDGLITIGEIPPEAVKQAAAYSGLKYAMLEDKPLMA